MFLFILFGTVKMATQSELMDVSWDEWMQWNSMNKIQYRYVAWHLFYHIFHIKVSIFYDCRSLHLIINCFDFEWYFEILSVPRENIGFRIIASRFIISRDQKHRKIVAILKIVLIQPQIDRELQIDLNWWLYRNMRASIYRI